MRKGLLAFWGVLFWCAAVLIFGVSIGRQCLQTQAASREESLQQPKPFPWVVQGTELRALQWVRYEGPFWEDGTGEEVAAVAGLVVENTGGETVASGAVVLEWEDATLVFELSLLPPGERVLVLEKNRQQFPQVLPQECYGWSRGEYTENMGQVTVEAAGGMTMAVVNHTEDRIPLTQISYKTRDPESGLYLGGVTYTVEVRNLRPGERRLLTPHRFVCGGSTVVRVLLYPEI